jgi:hypothetical protein
MLSGLENNAASPGCLYRLPSLVFGLLVSEFSYQCHRPAVLNNRQSALSSWCQQEQGRSASLKLCSLPTSKLIPKLARLTFNIPKLRRIGECHISSFYKFCRSFCIFPLALVASNVSRALLFGRSGLWTVTDGISALHSGMTVTARMLRTLGSRLATPPIILGASRHTQKPARVCLSTMNVSSKKIRGL